MLTDKFGDNRRKSSVSYRRNLAHMRMGNLNAQGDVLITVICVVKWIKHIKIGDSYILTFLSLTVGRIC